MESLYTTEALSTGGGRDGHVRTVNGKVDLDMTVQKELGGSGAGSNPEDLFAAGYAACFHSALRATARSEKIAIDDSTVGARVGIGRDDTGGYSLEVVLEVTIPGLDHETAQQLVEGAHRRCAYSKATRGNIPVTLITADD